MSQHRCKGAGRGREESAVEISCRNELHLTGLSKGNVIATPFSRNRGLALRGQNPAISWEEII